LCCDCGKKHRNIRFMTDHIPRVPHRSRIRIVNDLRACQVDHPAVVLNEFFRLWRRQSLRMDEKVLFDFITD
jgi:hypothetical protein